tara:strand:- start:7338 stop:7958 length:621 start_codon:yes stop_codon:yes gene_type:complete
MIGISLLGSAFSMISNNRKASKMRSQAIKDAKYQSPEELAYVEKLQKRSVYGNENLQQQKNLALQPIRSMGQQTKQQAVGQAIRQGLENSVIASDIRARLDAKTQSQLSQVSEKIALMNEQYKQQQEQSLDKYHLSRADRIRNITGQANQSFHQNTSSGWDLAGSLLNQFGSATMKGKYWDGNQFVLGGGTDDPDTKRTTIDDDDF